MLSDMLTSGPRDSRRFGEASGGEICGGGEDLYVNDPVALHLRAMNMLYEGLKQNSTIVIVPGSAIETMQLGGLAGPTALTMGLGRERATQGEKRSNAASLAA